MIMSAFLTQHACSKITVDAKKNLNRFQPLATDKTGRDNDRSAKEREPMDDRSVVGRLSSLND